MFNPSGPLSRKSSIRTKAFRQKRKDFTLRTRGEHVCSRGRTGGHLGGGANGRGLVLFVCLFLVLFLHLFLFLSSFLLVSVLFLWFRVSVLVFVRSNLFLFFVGFCSFLFVFLFVFVCFLSFSFGGR